MEKPRTTPEEELLSLIQEGEGFGKAKPKRRKRKHFSSGALRRLFKAPLYLYESFYDFAKKTLNKFRGDGQAGLKPAISVMLIVAIILLVYLVVDFGLDRPDISRIERRSFLDKPEYVIDPVKLDSRTFLSYLAMVKRRDIFSPFTLVETQVEDKQEPREDLRQTARELSSELRLVGILLSPEPQAMVEDRRTNETFFLKEGDIVNKLEIQEILSDRVILNYQGESIELL